MTKSPQKKSYSRTRQGGANASSASNTSNTAQSNISRLFKNMLSHMQEGIEYKNQKNKINNMRKKINNLNLINLIYLNREILLLKLEYPGQKIYNTYNIPIGFQKEIKGNLNKFITEIRRYYPSFLLNIENGEEIPLLRNPLVIKSFINLFENEKNEINKINEKEKNVLSHHQNIKEKIIGDYKKLIKKFKDKLKSNIENLYKNINDISKLYTSYLNNFNNITLNNKNENKIEEWVLEIGDIYKTNEINNINKKNSVKNVFIKIYDSLIEELNIVASDEELKKLFYKNNLKNNYTNNKFNNIYNDFRNKLEEERDNLSKKRSNTKGQPNNKGQSPTRSSNTAQSSNRQSRVSNGRSTNNGQPNNNRPTVQPPTNRSSNTNPRKTNASNSNKLIRETYLVHKALCEDNKSTKMSTGFLKKIGFRKGELGGLDKRYVVVSYNKNKNRIKNIVWESKSKEQKLKKLSVENVIDINKENAPSKFRNFKHVYQIKGTESKTGERCYIFGSDEPMI